MRVDYGDICQMITADRPGIGVGLSIARKAVRAHRGEIHIRNMPGKGCVFVIDVPLAAAQTAPQSVS